MAGLVAAKPNNIGMVIVQFGSPAPIESQAAKTAMIMMDASTPTPIRMDTAPVEAATEIKTIAPGSARTANAMTVNQTEIHAPRQVLQLKNAAEETVKQTVNVGTITVQTNVATKDQHAVAATMSKPVTTTTAMSV